MKTKALTAVALLVLLLLPGVSHALTDDQTALVGLKGVQVVVEKIDPQAELLGLTKAQIKTEVELRLRKAGIRVLTGKERLETPEMPWLYVNVTVFPPQDLPLAAFSIHVELKEIVTLANGSTTVGSIWDTGYVGIVGKEKIREMRKLVDDYVDKFINDYLAANPKK